MGVPVRLSANGRVCIPADVRASLGLKEGDLLVLNASEDGIVLRTREQAIRKAQALSRKMLEGKPNCTVDDFIADKRREAAREAEEY